MLSRLAIDIFQLRVPLDWPRVFQWPVEMSDGLLQNIFQKNHTSIYIIVIHQEKVNEIFVENFHNRFRGI